MFCEYEVYRHYCSNCGTLGMGHKNAEGRLKFECVKCGTVSVMTMKSRRHVVIDAYAPRGCSMIEEDDYVPSEDESLIV